MLKATSNNAYANYSPTVWEYNFIYIQYDLTQTQTKWIQLQCWYYEYKKFELMLTRREKAYSSSCSQVILLYLHPFCSNLLFCSQKSPKNHNHL